MQFDEKDLNDDKFSLDDNSGSISWEDLLNADEDVDLSSLIKGTKEEEPIEKKEENDLDIGSFVDNDTNNEPAKAQAVEPVVQQTPPAQQFDVTQAASNYVNSLEAEETVVEEAPKVQEIVSISPNGDSRNPDDDIPSADFTYEDELLKAEAPNDDDVYSNKDLSGVVDDELLSLLNEGTSAHAPVDIQISNDIEEDDILGDLDKYTDNDETDYSDSKEIEPKESSSDTSYEDDSYYVQTPKKRTSVFAVMLLGLLLLAGGILLGINMLTNGGSNAGGDLAVGPDSNFNVTEEIAQTTPDVAETAAPKKAEKDKAKKDDKDKKENKENKTQKVVVNIPVSGRSNPFVPSSLFDDRGYSIFGSDLSTPPEVNVNDPEVQAARKLFTISVSGIMYDPKKPSAILRFDNRDYFVQKGDKIDSYIVNEITKEYVAIRNSSNIYKAYVGESFNVGDATIPAANTVKIEGGQRHYVSADDIQISTREN